MPRQSFSAAVILGFLAGRAFPPKPRYSRPHTFVSSLGAAPWGDVTGTRCGTVLVTRSGSVPGTPCNAPSQTEAFGALVSRTYIRYVALCVSVTPGAFHRAPPPHLLASGLCWSPANTCACGGVSARNVAARVPSKFREGRRPFSGGQLCGRCVVRAMHGLLIGGTSRVHPLVLIPSPCMRWWSSRRGQPASLIASRLA